MSGELTGRVVVVSPHLDDAAFSLGAAVAAATRTGADVTVLTVFACDPDSEAPAAWWDRKAGFATLGEAARARRAEDLRACEAVGARPVWLPFDDATYEEQHDEHEVWTALAEAVDGADAVLMPGFPLVHVDHAWLHALLRRRRPPGAGRLGLYVEQPYRWRRRKEPLPSGIDWRHLRSSLADRRAKRRAFDAYASQVPLFGIQPRRRIALYEALQGGEAVAWL